MLRSRSDLGIVMSSLPRVLVPPLVTCDVFFCSLLTLQVLRWLQHFSDRVEERAKGAAAEVNGLLKEAEALELDMKTAVVAFDHLTRQRITEHASRGSNPLHCHCPGSLYLVELRSLHN